MEPAETLVSAQGTTDAFLDIAKAEMVLCLRVAIFHPPGSKLAGVFKMEVTINYYGNKSLNLRT